MPTSAGIDGSRYRSPASVPLCGNCSIPVTDVMKGDGAMKRYVCSICGYVYDETKGAPDAKAPAGTYWDTLADDWVCPLCDAAKAEFRMEGELQQAAVMATVDADAHSSLKSLPALEMSAVCSNLARGCEKQYIPQEASWYRELKAYFKGSAGKQPDASYQQMLELTRADLDSTIAESVAVARAEGDRGAQRALIWDEKVTRIHKSLLMRYMRDGDAMFDRVNAYVCTACGFIYLGAEPPELCPVCKVPAWKFEKVEGRVQA